MDAFFASVEQVDNPKLKGKPIIVGGDSDRGVVCTCSYEARKFGIHSAMSSKIAKKLCPHAIFIRGNHNRYKQVSEQVFDIIEGITDRVEKVSIDEAYIDISDLYSSSDYIAKLIKKKIYDKTGLTCSVGISYNKFLAKLASDWNKPNGIFEIKQENVETLLDDLPIIKIHGLGKKTVEKFNNIGIFKVRDLKKYSVEALSSFMGENRAKEIYNRIRGIDNREVKNISGRKSFGKELTLSKDTKDREELFQIIQSYLDTLVHQIHRKNVLVKTVTIKLKYSDFTIVNRSHTFDVYTDDYDKIFNAMKLVFDKLDFEQKIRLIGVSLSNIIEKTEVQLDIFSLCEK